MSSSRVFATVALALFVLPAGCAHSRPEGEWVRSLELRGIHNISKSKLEKGLATRPTPGWKAGPERPYNELELERDRHRVIRYYESQGYYAAKVVQAEARKVPGSNAVDIVMSVREGPPTLIGDVQVFGVDGLDKKTRKKIQQYQLGLRRGQVFHHSDYEKFKGDLTRVLKKLGYDETSVEGSVEIAPSTNLATIILRFHPHGVTDASSMPMPVTTPVQSISPAAPAAEGAK
ncbi:MAG: POTRA domain-containing protein [Polyangia bacterium]